VIGGLAGVAGIAAAALASSKKPAPRFGRPGGLVKKPCGCGR
jgi:hypothetical protein